MNEGNIGPTEYRRDINDAKKAIRATLGTAS